MSPVRYARERVESRLRPISIDRACRILRLGNLDDPLQIHPAVSRFCDGTGSSAVLYAAREFATAFVETVVRDRFTHRQRRRVPLDDILARGWVEFATGAERLALVDLTGSGCVDLGAPTDAVRARHLAAGQALGRAIYVEHPDVDGFLYPSRLTGEECLAILDRAVEKLLVRSVGSLEDHPDLPGVLERYTVGIERE